MKTGKVIEEFSKSFENEKKKQEETHPTYLDFTGFDFPNEMIFKKDFEGDIYFNSAVFRKDVEFGSARATSTIHPREHTRTLDSLTGPEPLKKT